MCTLKHSDDYTEKLKEAAKINLIFYFSISEMSLQHVINILKLLMKYFIFPF